MTADQYNATAALAQVSFLAFARLLYMQAIGSLFNTAVKFSGH